ncbi:MAG: radical SAM protein [Sphingobacteriales bacterium]|nr:MAG: radical SAM protein [Sphingobacteriales bacterium]
MKEKNDFLDQLDEFIPHIEFAQFSGGEPFLIEHYYKILEKISVLNPNCGIHIQTNGLVLNNRVKKILGKCKCNIGISLDATTKEVYEKVRINGNFDRLKNNLEYFYNYCKENNTHFSLTFAPTNIACYEIPDAIILANKYETNIFLNVVWEPINVAIWSMSTTELESLYEYYLTIELPQGTPIQQKNSRQFEHLKNHVLVWIKQAKEREQYKKNLEQKELQELQELLLTNLIDFNKHKLYDWLTDTKIEDAKAHYIDKLNQLNNLDKHLQKKLTINLLSYPIESTYREVNNYLHLYIY